MIDTRTQAAPRELYGPGWDVPPGLVGREGQAWPR